MRVIHTNSTQYQNYSNDPCFQEIQRDDKENYLKGRVKIKFTSCIKNLVKAFVFTIFTLGVALASKHVRDLWKTGFTGKEVVIVRQSTGTKLNVPLDELLVAPTATETNLSGDDFDDSEQRLEGMGRCFSIYKSGYCPTQNRGNLDVYIQSEDFIEHCKTARVYHSPDLTKEQAREIAWKREPVNLAMHQLYDKDELEEFCGHKVSAFNEQGSPYRNKPNTVAIYSKTYLWSVPGGDYDTKKEVGILSVPAPALDSPHQPHWNYYMGAHRQLNRGRYRKEMLHLAKTVVLAAIENKPERLVISRYGQASFTGALSPRDRVIALEEYYQTLVAVIIANREALEGIEIVMSEFGNRHIRNIIDNFVNPLEEAGIETGVIHGDILRTAINGDLIVNAWDPHSLPGNGCDNDGSLDGALGKGTGIPIVQNPWLNPAFVQQGFPIFHTV